MADTYTESFTIGTGGSSAGCNALLAATTSNTSAIVEFWRNPAGSTAAVTLTPGVILPVKVRRIISASAAITGLN